MYFTVGEFIDNIEKNGLPQRIGALFDYPTVDISSGRACAYGQGIWNQLGRPRTISQGVLDELIAAIDGQTPNLTNPTATYGYDKSFGDHVVDLNDSYRLPIVEVAQRMREIYADYLDQVIFYDENQDEWE